MAARRGIQPMHVRRWEPAALASRTEVESRESAFVILSDRSGIGAGLASLLRSGAIAACCGNDTKYWRPQTKRRICHCAAVNGVRSSVISLGWSIYVGLIQRNGKVQLTSHLKLRSPVRLQYFRLCSRTFPMLGPDSGR